MNTLLLALLRELNTNGSTVISPLSVIENVTYTVALIRLCERLN